MRKERIRMENISKEIYHTKIVSHVDLSLYAGEIVAILGANGAGKTVLMEILAGIVNADEGKIFYEEYPVELRSPKEAKQLKIEYIPSHGGYIDSLTVFENLYFDNENCFLIWGKEQKKEAKHLLEEMGLSLALHHRYRKLDIGKKKMIKVAAAVRKDVKILLMDEPFAFLNQSEKEQLIAILSQLKKKGTGILLTMHQLFMAKELCDRGVVLRDGRQVGTFSMKEIEIPQILTMMTGTLHLEKNRRERLVEKRVRLKVEQLAGDGIIGANFQVLEGEILGIAGLSGSGRTKIMDLLFGLRKKTAGRMYMDGQQVEIKSPEDAIRYKIAYASNKEGQLGIIDIISVRDNILLPSLAKVSYGGCVNERLGKYLAWYYMEVLLCGELKSACTLYQEKDSFFFLTEESMRRPVHELSLGFYQVVKLAQCLSIAPKVLLLDHPTLGLDISMKGKIYHLLKQLSRQGMSIVIVSDEMEELASLCHRVLVFHQGVITGELTGEEVENGSPFSQFI